MRKKVLIISGVVIVAILIIGGTWLFFTRGDSSQQNAPADLFTTTEPTDTAPAQNTATELPDVVARVNGKDITKAELESSESQILASQGIDPTTLNDDMRKQLITQALDGLVSNTLLREATANSGVTAEESEIDAQLATVKGQFDDDAKYQEALAQQGMTEADLRAVIASDLAVQKYLETTLNLKAVDISEEDLAVKYQQEVAAAASSTEPLPPLEEIHDQFKTFYVQQQQQQMIVDHVKELSNGAKIEILI